MIRIPTFLIMSFKYPEIEISRADGFITLQSVDSHYHSTFSLGLAKPPINRFSPVDNLSPLACCISLKASPAKTKKWPSITVRLKVVKPTVYMWEGVN